MPSPISILASTAQIANDLQTLALAWHCAVAEVLTAMLLGWRPSQRLLAALLVLPIVSVSAVAWAYDNSFTGFTFALLALVLASTTRDAPRQRIAWAGWPQVTAGMGLVGLGIVYPHFVRVGSWPAYLAVAPFALIPCPTLMVVIGTTFVVRHFGSARWRTTLVAAGLFYGAIGVLRLRVALDWPLLAGAMTSASPCSIRRRQERRWHAFFFGTIRCTHDSRTIRSPGGANARRGVGHFDRCLCRGCGWRMAPLRPLARAAHRRGR